MQQSNDNNSTVTSQQSNDNKTSMNPAQASDITIHIIKPTISVSGMPSDYSPSPLASDPLDYVELSAAEEAQFYRYARSSPLIRRQ